MWRSVSGAGGRLKLCGQGLDKWNICSYVRVVGWIDDSIVEEIMVSRLPLTEKESRRVQRAYHKGTEAQQQILQELFGREITYTSCMAMVDQAVRNRKDIGKVTSVVKPTENEFWDRLCCATYHGYLWGLDFLWPDDGFNPSRGSNIYVWIQQHCEYMVEPFLYEDYPLYRIFSVPDPIPASLETNAYRYGSPTIARIAKFFGIILLGAVVLIVNFFLTRWLNATFPITATP